MCGIVGVLMKQDSAKKSQQVAEAVHDIFEDQVKRGVEGFGIVGIGNKGGIKLHRCTEIVSALMSLRFDFAGKKGILMHHRNPTSTPNKISQTHPIYVSHELLKHDYFVVHNGVIANEHERKKDHEELGFKYTTQLEEKPAGYRNDFNDTEAVAIDFALAIENLEDTIKARGGAALVALQVEKESLVCKKIFIWRNGNPLNFLETDEAFVFSSQGPGTEIKTERLIEIDLATNTTIESALKQAVYAYTPTVKEIGFKTSETLPYKKYDFVYSNAIGKSYTRNSAGDLVDYSWNKLSFDENRKVLAEEMEKRTKPETNKPSPKSQVEKMIEDEEQKRRAQVMPWDDIIENTKSNAVLDELDDNNLNQEKAENTIEDLFSTLQSAEDIWTLEPKKELQKALSKIAKVYLDHYKFSMQTVHEAIRTYEASKNDPKPTLPFIVESEPQEMVEEYEQKFSHAINDYYYEDKDGILRALTDLPLTPQEVQQVRDEEEMNLEYAAAVGHG